MSDIVKQLTEEARAEGMAAGVAQGMAAGMAVKQAEILKNLGMTEAEYQAIVAKKAQVQ